jgi:MOSC domain-containing protein YiiM
MHLSYADLEAGLAALPAPPADAGTVVLVVARPATDERRTPERARLTPEAGVEGDRWGNAFHRSTDSQITVMRADVARLFANGQSLTLFGDNFLVDLDISAANLPAGSRLRVGTALCEVTPKPHTGCGKFSARFGEEARAVTAAPAFDGWRLRGFHLRVLEAGEAGPGDAIQVLERPAPRVEASVEHGVLR